MKSNKNLKKDRRSAVSQKSSSEKANILKINPSIYLQFEEGTHLVKITDTKIIEKDYETYIILNLQNQEGATKSFSIRYDQDSDSVFAKLIRAVFEDEEDEISSEDLIEKIISVKIKRNNGYMNIVDIEEQSYDKLDFEEDEEEDIEEKKVQKRKGAKKSKYTRKRKFEDEEEDEEEDSDEETDEEEDIEEKKVQKRKGAKKSKYTRKRKFEEDDSDEETDQDEDVYYDEGFSPEL